LKKISPRKKLRLKLQLLPPSKKGKRLKKLKLKERE